MASPDASSEQVVAALRKSLQDNERLRQENDTLRSGTADETEPIAVVGMACRFPGGVRGPDELWSLLTADPDAADAVGPWPTDRGWVPERDAPGGAFVDDVAGFDAAFFGIAPREALAMDPQQRLLLETAWHAVEDAGIAPTALRGTRSGVFVGASNQEYGSHLVDLSDELGGHVLTGNTLSVASGRLAYVLGTEGPALTVDTACSSSLVAMHLATAALRAQECDLALAGGVTVMSTSDAFAEFARQGGLSADGRCKAFSDDADGTGWGEGVGLVVLERLSVAREAGHRVLAVLCGSAINSDGASNGLTAPNGPAQQRVIRDALAAAGLGAGDVDAVEAHGTGTSLGDPIEAQALLATYGAAARAHPLLLGSVKSNLGHTQAAAGVAGVIKAVLALQHGTLPATLHAERPSSRVAWDSGRVQVASTPTDLPAGLDRPWRVGVSSFGISGTNAHVVLEGVSDVPSPTSSVRIGTSITVPWRVSARDARARAALGRCLRGLDADPDLVAAALDHRRPLLSHRAAVLPGADLEDALTALASGDAHPHVVTGTARRGATTVVLPGQGAQRPGMGRDLCEAFEVYATAFDAAVAAVDAQLSEGSLRDVVRGEDAERLNRTEWAQPALFVMQVAGFRLLESWGLSGPTLVGHSVGEIAAAHLAGALDLADAARLVVARGRLMGALPEGGSMAAVSGAPEIDLPDTVSVAAYNSASSLVLSGETEALEQVLGGLPETARVSRLHTSHAFHSPLMAPAADDLAAVAADLTWHTPTLTVVSTVTGEPVGPGTWSDPGHWATQLTAPVRFADAITTAKPARVVEVGPKASLTGHVAADHPDTPATCLGEGHHAAAALWASGEELPGWAPTTAPTTHVSLPRYPFTHERFWPAASETPEAGLTYRDDWVPYDPVPGRAPAAITVVAPPGLALADALAAALGGGTVTSVDDPVAVPEGTDLVVSLLARGEAPLSRTLALLQTTTAPVWTVLHDTAHDPVGSGVAGLVRSVAAEQGQRRLGTVDLADTAGPGVAEALTAAILGAGTESELAVTGEGVRVRRLVRVADPTRPPEQHGWPGTTLITGGTGALGALVARRLAERGAEHLLLVGRRGPDAPGVDDLRAELTAAGAAVSVVAADVADPDALRELTANLDPPLRAVVHAAGVLDDALATDLDVARLDAVWRPKAAAALALDTATRDADLHAFVLFSSVAGVLPTAGQGNYAAANAALDGLARRRRAAGLPATAIAWGPWDGAGMPDDPAVADALRRSGVTLLDPARALDLLEAALGGDHPALAVTDVDWSLVAAAAAGGPPPLIAALVPSDGAATPAGGTGTEKPAALPATLAALPAAARSAHLIRVVRGETARALGHRDPARIDPDAGFRDLGLDSMTGVAVRNALAEATGLDLAAGIVYDHPSVRALAEHLLERLDGIDTGSGTTARPTAVDTDDPIALVAVACRLPGGVGSPEDLWDLLERGGDAIGPFPDDRGWDLDYLDDPHGERPWSTTVARGGFVDDAALFDAGLFGISPREALATDPQQRLLLEVAWEAIERAGIAPDALRGTRTGVIAGAGYQGYGADQAGLSEDVAAHLLTGSSGAVVSGRLAYVLGTEGPTYTVDTACSSSLVALHLAAAALRSGECDLALAGGVTVMSTPGAFIAFSRQGGLAADGRCKAFSDDADGTGWAEGAAMVVLERLSDARAAGHPVLGVLRGSAVNSDGASNGLTAPHGPSQQRVIRDALAASGLGAADVDAVEAHGTGTALGDPIEAQALVATYGAAPDRAAPLWLGSVKSNLGHTQAAAGAAGVIKALAALQHGRFPATLHAATPSTRVDWSAGTVRPAADAVDLPADLARPWRIGVSSFGISGTNAHVIIEAAGSTSDAASLASEARITTSSDRDTPAMLLAGADDEAVRGWARAMRARLDGAAREERDDVAAAVAHRRAALVQRAAVLLEDDPADTLAALDALADDADHPGVVRGVAVAGQSGVVLPGQGAQRLGMGRDLHAGHAVYAAAFDAAVAAVDAQLDEGSVRDVVWGEDEAMLARTEWAQPALFVVQVAGYRLLESWGLTGPVLVGHSVGEIAAAHLSGALGLDDAARLVVARGRLMGALPEGGSMAAVSGSFELGELPDSVSVAAYNSGASLVLSGETGALEQVLSGLGEQTRVSRLHTSHAFHSPLMAPAAEDLAAVAAGLTWHAPALAVLSTVTGELVGPDTWADPRHWATQLTSPVRFAEAIAAAVGEQDVARLVEIGSRPSLTGHIAADHPEVPTTALEDPRLAAATLWASGADLAGWIPAPTGHVDLPTYPFTHRRYWLTPVGAPPAFSRGTESGLHVLDWVPAGDAPADDRTVVTVEADTAARALPRLQEALADPDVTVVVVTRGAVAVGGTEEPDPAQAAIRGLALGAAVEEPGRVRLVDVHTDTETSGRPDEPDLALRGDRALVPRWRPVDATAEHETDLPALGERPVVLTGGTGGVGAVLARHLVAAGARHLVLTGRRGADDPDVAAARDAVADGDGDAVVEVVACDVTDADAVGELIAGLPDTPALVVHAAGVLDDGVLGAQDPDRLARVLAVKVDALAGLDAALGDDVELIALSSVAGTLGSAGQSTYAAANAALDAWATRRHRAGARRRSVVWGPWDVGMAARTGTAHAAAGLTPLDAVHGARLFDAARARPEPVVIAAPVDPAGLVALGDAAPAMWRSLPRAEPVDEPVGGPASSGQDGSWRVRLAGTAPAEREAEVLDLVRREAATALGHDDVGEIGADRDFRGLGVDSLSSVALRNRLATATGERLPATVVFDFPTPRRLAAHLVARVAGEDAALPAARRDVTDEPIAVVGIGCRFPGGVTGPEELWDLLDAGTDAVGPPPRDRGWDLRRLGASVPAGGFLDDVAGFDAAFFGVSGREALAMDPQQRLLLETSWEAVEHAGIDPASLRGTATGVFAGTNGQDYTGVLLASPDGADSAGGHIGTGNAASVLSGRIAYTLGTEGPAVTVDTACSSSLVALHWAAGALRSGECDRALAGGVTVMSSPGVFVEFSRAGGLAADGRCKAFAEGADGTGWGEGVGMLVLERLSDAQAAGRRVLAVLRGSAVNSDGASNGLTAPNGPAQQRVIREALAAGGLTEADVDAVEAHGTGTSLGDPIEAQALLATYGSAERAEPLWIRSVKANLGHTQGAAGVAGVIAMIGALRRAHIPASPHVDAPSSHVAWEDGAVRVAQEPVPWPAADRPRRAGVSSFGISGTNAHVVLESCASDAASLACDARIATSSVGDTPMLVSAVDDDALRAWGHVIAVLADTDTDRDELAAALAHTRTAFDRRAAVLPGATDEADDALAALAALAAGERHRGLVTGTVRTGPTVVVLAGQGAQRLGMGRDLCEAFEVYASAFDAAVAAVDAQLSEGSLRDVVGGEDEAMLARTEWAQPALFVVQVAGYRLLESWGLTNPTLVGHSVGEIAAAHLSGALDLADAARLVVARGKLMGALPEGGSMAAVSRALEIDLPDTVSVAADNSASSLVLSGETEALEQVLGGLPGTARVQRLHTSHAFHSPLMAPAADDLAAVAAGLTWHAPTLSVISTVTGEPVTPDTWSDPGHWAGQLTAPVRFADAITTANPARVVEIGPHPSLTGHVAADHPDTPTACLGEKDTDATLAAHRAAAGLWTSGEALTRWIPAPTAHVDLPTYPFTHRRYWPAAPAHDADALPPRHVTWEPVATGRPTGTWAVVGVAPDLTRALEEHVTVASENADGVLAVVDDPAAIPDLVRAHDGVDTRLWVVTRNATEATGVPDPAAAAVWGLGRTVALEHAGLWGGLIDLPTEPTPDDLAAAVGALGGAEDQVAIRDGQARGRRLTDADDQQAPWTPHGTVVVTGGTGALGRQLARRLATEGAERIVLTSRRGAEAEGLDDLRAELPVPLHVEAVDVADPDAVTRLLDAESPTTVVHAAGVLDDAPVTALDAEILASAARPKADGAAVLDAATRGRDVLLVVLTSVAGIWGGGSQGAYAAANAAADAVVTARRAAGERAVALGFGPWEGAGMAADEQASTALARRGLRPIPPDTALDATLAAIGADRAVTVLADLDVDRFVATMTASRPQPLLRGLAPQQQVDEDETAGEPPWRARWRDADDRRGVLVTLARAEVGDVLAHPDPERIDASTAFRDLGLDSVTGVELRDRLRTATGLDLDATLVFDHPSLEALAAELDDQLGSEGPEETTDLLTTLDRLHDRLRHERLNGDTETVKARLTALLALFDESGRTAHDRLADADDDALFAFIEDEIRR